MLNALLTIYNTLQAQKCAQHILNQSQNAYPNGKENIYNSETFICGLIYSWTTISFSNKCSEMS